MKLNTRFIAITSLIILAIASRLLPHIPNVTAVTAVALFGAANYNKKILAFLVPVTIMLLSDFCLGGFYKGVEWVYGTFALITVLGFTLRNRVSVSRVMFLSIISSLCIYIFTDFGMWLFSGIYTHTWQGFTECYIAALPFLRNGLLGDLFYCALLFGIFYLAQLKFPKLLKQEIK